MKETFGQRFQRLRKGNNLTQEEVANRVNVTPQAVSKWENDISSPDISLLNSLADLFNISLDELLGREKAITEIVNKENRKDINKMILKVLVLSNSGDKVNVNIPMPLIIAIVNGSDSQLKIGKQDLSSMIDFKQIISLVEQGVIGELVSIESSDGDTVKIFVE